jgi:hypothetical protein
MIELILTALEVARSGKTEYIDIAKGKYKLPKNWNEFKRKIKWQLKG